MPFPHQLELILALHDRIKTASDLCGKRALPSKCRLLLTFDAKVDISMMQNGEGPPTYHDIVVQHNLCNTRRFNDQSRGVVDIDVYVIVCHGNCPIR